MDTPRSPLATAYAPESFRQLGHRLVDLLADHLERTTRREGPVLPWAPPETHQAAFPAHFPELPEGDASALLARVVEASHHLHHPRYVGHQVSAPLPLAALSDFVSSFLNNGMAVYEMGPVATALEHNVLGWMAGQLGLPAGARGVLTSGGSAGNLTALLAARQARAGHDAWTGGAHAGPPLTVLVPETAHYCLARATRVMGWGEGGITPVPVDAHYRLRPEALEDALAEAQAREGSLGESAVKAVEERVEARLAAQVFFPTRVNVTGATVSFLVPDAFLGGPARASWGYAVAVTGAVLTQRVGLPAFLGSVTAPAERGLLVMGIGPRVSTERFSGGRIGGPVQSPVVDLIVPEGIRQEDVLGPTPPPWPAVVPQPEGP